MTSNEKFATVKLTKSFVHWAKVEAAKAGKSFYQFIEESFPGVPKKVRNQPQRSSQ